eukprot:gene570-616_t
MDFINTHIDLPCLMFQSPTFAPTTIPTPSPTLSTIPSSTPLLSTGGIIGIVLAAAVILASFAIVEYYRRYQSARAVLNRQRLDRLNELPVHRALLEIPVGGIYDDDDNGVTALRGPAILRQNSRMFFSLNRNNLDLSERAGRSVLEVVLPVIERYGDTTATLLDFDNKTALDIALERIPIILGTDKGSQSHRVESGKKREWYNIPWWLCGSRTSTDSVVNERGDSALTKQRIDDYAAIVCALVQQQLPPEVTFQDNPFHIKQTHGSGKGGITENIFHCRTHSHRNCKLMYNSRLTDYGWKKNIALLYHVLTHLHGHVWLNVTTTCVLKWFEEYSTYTPQKLVYSRILSMRKEGLREILLGTGARI